MRFTTIVLLLIALFVFGRVNPAVGAEKYGWKRAGLINGLEGEPDSRLIAAALQKKGILFHEMGEEWIPLDEFLKHLQVLVVSGNPWFSGLGNWPNELSTRELEALQVWVQNGGRILFLNDGVRMVRKEREKSFPDWTGITDLARADSTLNQVAISASSYPFLFSVLRSEVKPWMTEGYVVRGTLLGSSVIAIHDRRSALLFVQNVGKGQIIHFGRRAYRYMDQTLYSIESREMDTAKRTLVREAILEQQSILIAIAGSWPRLLMGSDLLRTAKKELPRKKDLYAWCREPDHDRLRSDSPAFFADPVPHRGDQLSHIEMNVGREEFESFFFYLTNFGSDRSISVRVSKLESSSGNEIPAGQILIRVQSPILKTAPEPSVDMRGKDRPIWLYRQEQLSSDGKPHFDIAKFDQRVVWLTLPPWKGPSDRYEGEVIIRAGNSDAIRIPLTVRVYEVPVRNSLISLFTTIDSVTRLPGAGSPERRKFEAYLRLLRDYGSDLIEILWPSSEKTRRVVVERTGKSIQEVLQTSPEMLKDDSLPRLDFSDFSSVLEPARQMGFKGLITRGGLASPFSLQELQNLYEDKELSWNSDEGRRIQTWYFAEWLRYIRSLGFDGQRLRLYDELDELGDDGVPFYNSRAAAPQAAGFKTGATLLSFNSTSRQRIRELDPETSCWMIQAKFSLGFRDATDGLRNIDPADEILLWTWKWENYTYAEAHEELWRAFFPVAGTTHSIGLYYAGLIRPPGYSTVVEDDQGFIVAVAMEAYRDALDALKLYRALLLARPKMDPQLRQIFDAQLARIVGTADGSLIHYDIQMGGRLNQTSVPQTIPVLVAVPPVDLVAYREAKRRLLELSELYAIWEELTFNAP